MVVQYQLFDDKEYLDTTIELKNKIKKLISNYENENSNFYLDTEMLITLIKMIIFY